MEAKSAGEWLLREQMQDQMKERVMPLMDGVSVLKKISKAIHVIVHGVIYIILELHQQKKNP